MHKVSLICIRSIHYSNNCDLLRKYCSGHWTVWVRAGAGDLRGSSWNLSAHLNGRRHREWHGLLALWMLMSSQGTGDEDTQRSLWDCTARRWCSTWLPHAYTNTHTDAHAWNTSIISPLFWTCQIFDRVALSVSCASGCSGIWGQDIGRDWGCEDASAVAWRNMSVGKKP